MARQVVQTEMQSSTLGHVPSLWRLQYEDQQHQHYQDTKVPVFGKHEDLPSSGIENASIPAGDC